MNRINRFVVGRDCYRPTLDSTAEAGLTVTQVERTTMPKVPKFASPVIVGSATVPAVVPSSDGQRSGSNRS